MNPYEVHYPENMSELRTRIIELNGRPARLISGIQFRLFARALRLQETTIGVLTVEGVNFLQLYGQSAYPASAIVTDGTLKRIIPRMFCGIDTGSDQLELGNATYLGWRVDEPLGLGMAERDSRGNPFRYHLTTVKSMGELDKLDLPDRKHVRLVTNDYAKWIKEYLNGDRDPENIR